eukprot:COSAG01_NODE_957_length_12474_cov_44.298182_12_plen_85_part_00
MCVTRPPSLSHLIPRQPAFQSFQPAPHGASVAAAQDGMLVKAVRSAARSAAAVGERCTSQQVASSMPNEMLLALALGMKPVVQL